MRTTLKAKSSLIPGLVLISTAIWIAAWAASFPATMTLDSLNQWEQIQSGRYTDWHPVAHTLLLQATLLVWASPGALILLQIGAMAALLTWGLILLRDQLHAPTWMLVITAGFFALHPVHAANLCTVWKDIPYSIAFTAFTLGLLQTCHQPNRPVAWPLLAATALPCLLLRHNGLIGVAAGFIALGFMRSQLRAASLCLLAIGALYTGLHSGLRAWLHAPSAPVTERLAIPLQQTAAIIASGQPLSPTQAKGLAAVLPLEKWRDNYSRRTVDTLKFDPEFNPAAIQSDLRGFLGLWLGLVLQHPGIAFTAWLRQTMVMWDPRQDAHATFPQGIPPNVHGLDSTPLSDRLQIVFHQVYATAAHPPWSWLTRPACFHLVLLIAAVLCGQSAGVKALLPFVPLGASLGAYFLVLPVADFRYFYPGYMLLPFLLIHAWSCRQPTLRTLSSAT